MLIRSFRFYLTVTRVIDVIEFILRLRPKHRFVATLIDSLGISAFVALNMSALVSLFALCMIVMSVRPGGGPLPHAGWDIWLMCILGWFWMAYVFLCFRRGPPPLNLEHIKSD